MAEQMKPVDVLAVMDALEWGFNLRRCPICTGWDPNGNGETDHRHTESCPFPSARAAVAELVEYADSALAYVDAAAAVERERHRLNQAPNSLVVAQVVADRLRAALAAMRGGA